MSLNINIQKIEGLECYEITPIGEIDIYTSPEFKNAVLKIIEENKENIVINGEKLDYMDSTGLGILMSLLKKTKEKNIEIRLKNLKPNIYKLFDITGLNNVFNIER